MIRELLRQTDQRFMERMWRRLGCPVPPPAPVKRRMLAALIDALRAEVFVETGTYLGDTVAALQDHVRTIHSIELGEKLFRDAQRRFSGCDNVCLWHGDSGDVLPEVLSQIEGRCVFWLDGHYSAGITAKGIEDTPILRELTHIFSADLPPYIVAIDDARCFNGTGGYPCLQSLVTLVSTEKPGLQCLCGMDTVCFVPTEDGRIVAAVEKVLLM